MPWKLIKQLGDNSTAQMKQLVSVLAVQDSQVPTATSYPMSGPVAYINSVQFPGHIAGHTQTAAAPQGALHSTRSLHSASFTSNQDRVQEQCWHCSGDHYKSGCPLLSRPTRRTREIWHRGSTPMAIALRLSPMVA